ncbi:MAG: Gfo/Idh/MocA family oxidoreductase, partial [Thermoguttaceae bacterium]|nr:Gfo/Idh/MocA family oxidoreductase [Thermoguttaceae bacterium]
MTFSRRSFLARTLGAASLARTSRAMNFAQEQTIAGFDETQTNANEEAVWQPKSDRKIRMGIVGYGVCRFGAAFGLQNHPNVDGVAGSDLFPDRCEGLAKECHCEKTSPSLVEMVKDDSIEAIFVATDAPHHAEHCIEAMRHGKHVATAVPAVFGSLEDADRLYETVKETGLTYMMFETTAWRDCTYASRELYRQGLFGKMIYTEGEYYPYGCHRIDSLNGWRIGLPPQWYPTHSNGFYTCVTSGSFTEVTCYGTPSLLDPFKPENNAYGNKFGTEIALFKTSEGGTARMGVSWDAPGYHAEACRNHGQFGSFFDSFQSELADIREKAAAVDLRKPPLPPGVEAGGHGGSHGYLGNEFVEAILEERKPLVDIACALNTTVSG